MLINAIVRFFAALRMTGKAQFMTVRGIAGERYAYSVNRTSGTPWGEEGADSVGGSLSVRVLAL